MKLSQAILISLSILICFSPTISLAMEQVIDINDEFVDIQALVLRLKNNRTNFFKSINDPVAKYNCQKRLKKLSKKLQDFFKIQHKRLFIMLLIILFNFIPTILNVPYKFLSLPNFLIAQIITSVYLMGLGFLACFSTWARSTTNNLYYDGLNYSLLSKWDCVHDFNHGQFLESVFVNNRYDFVRFFLKHPNFVDFDIDKYTLQAIIRNFPSDIIELLFDKGAMFNKEDFNKVIECASFEMVKFLVDLGIDVNIKDINGTPAIITAVINKKLGIIDLLLSIGVDAGIEDAQGKTAIDYLYDQCDISDDHGIKEKFLQFRQRIAKQIYNDLEAFNFPQVQADLISEYLV